jgi:hypothetical protein
MSDEPVTIWISAHINIDVPESHPDRHLMDDDDQPIIDYAAEVVDKINKVLDEAGIKNIDPMDFEGKHDIHRA